ncbi:hypothetical protein AB1K70_09260 [Bremerella sp. JC770]|uniref:hypothetical protein n=1 Tax=Bremerella sp. JC770 TaxID=3232137 RepID=UPI00345B2A57
MSSTNARPDACGSLSPENAPQVVVRAGKTFVCSACGTLVEIPADLKGQWVLASASSPSKAPDQPDASGEVPDRVETATAVVAATESSSKTTSAPVHASPKQRPPRPKRPPAPKPDDLGGQAIEGLRVPSGKELHHAMAWVSFHLKVLDRQGSELQRLRKLLKRQRKAPTSCSHANWQAEEVTAEKPTGSSPKVNPSQTPEEENRTALRDDHLKRGPP